MIKIPAEYFQLVKPMHIAPGRLRFLIFRLAIGFEREEGMWTVDSPLPGLVESGLHESTAEAREEWVACFTGLVDFHIQRASLEDFLKTHCKRMLTDLEMACEDSASFDADWLTSW